MRESQACQQDGRQDIPNGITLATNQIVHALKGEDGQENHLHLLGMDAANLDENGHEDTHHSGQTTRALAKGTRTQLVNQHAHIGTHQTFENARHQKATAKDGVKDGQPKRIALVGIAHRVETQIPENAYNMASFQPSGKHQSRAMVPMAVARIVFVGRTRLIIIVVANGNRIDYAYHQGNEKHHPKEPFEVAVLPTGIEHHRHHEEKQNLAYPPQHPFRLQGIVSESQTDRKQSQQIQSYADERYMSQQFVSHFFEDYLYPIKPILVRPTLSNST